MLATRGAIIAVPLFAHQTEAAAGKLCLELGLVTHGLRPYERLRMRILHNLTRALRKLRKLVAAGRMLA